MFSCRQTFSCLDLGVSFLTQFNDNLQQTLTLQRINLSAVELAFPSIYNSLCQACQTQSPARAIGVSLCCHEGRTSTIIIDVVE